jgi:hypothetical protein
MPNSPSGVEAEAKAIHVVGARSNEPLPDAAKRYLT